MQLMYPLDDGGNGKASRPKTSSSQVYRNAVISSSSALSGNPMSLKLDLQLLFSRSATFRVSSWTFWHLQGSLLVSEEISSSILPTREVSRGTPQSYPLSLDTML
ncbi:hypothetical protein AMECASPLE_035035 [Ameca splendens]|uniref:Uncharacterized protein n=1 Tax=Ameca splendens TaxID=208324 RepID=A0ABV1A2N7_9TELE